MADPVTLAVVGGTLGAFGSIAEGEASAAAAEAGMDLAHYQARVAEKQAAERATRIRREGSRIQGRARAAVGASGVRLEGSPLEAMVDSARENELEALTAIYQGDLEAYGFNVEAARQKQAAKNARISGYIGAGTSLLSTGSQLSGMSGTTSGPTKNKG